MKLLVGLGNPGRSHAGQRHNIGMMAIDRIAAVSGVISWRDRHASLAADTRIGDRRVMLLKPQTFMNDSGMAVLAARDYFRIAMPDVIVLHDEIDLAPGKIRIKQGGGHAGHNGLRSIISHAGPDFIRVRIGIGHPGHKDKVHGHVLGDFSRRERESWLEPLLDRIANNISELIDSNSTTFINTIVQAQPAQAFRDRRLPDGEATTSPSGDWQTKLRAWLSWGQ